jgi:hypothetical protein
MSNLKSKSAPIRIVRDIGCAPNRMAIRAAIRMEIRTCRRPLTEK